MTVDSPRLRLGVLGVVVVSLFAALLARLWYLQVLAAPDYQVAAKTNRVRLVTTEAPRGRILDRQGRVLVDNRVSWAVVIARGELPAHRLEVVERLSGLLKVPTDILNRRIDDPRFSPYKPIPVAQDVPKDVLIYIREHQADFPGVDGVQLTERSYPQGNLAAHLLGYVGEINDKELAPRKSKGYRLGDTIGKSGVEQIFEEDLRGDPGIEKLEVDSKGRVLGSLGTRPPVQGHDVQLTMDLDVQHLAEQSLAQGLDLARVTFDKETGKHFVAPAGAIVVLDPRDGSVLALASNPTYDPAAFVNGIKPDVFQALQDPRSAFPLNNRAIQGLYSPGSTFKLVTALAALDKGLISPHTTVNDTGSFTVGDRVFKNAHGLVFGPVDITKALTVSSDVFFYNLGNQFWQTRGRFGDAIQDTARSLGLGQKTGIDIPFEADGRIPDPDTRRRLHDANPKAFPNGRWFAGDNVNLAIGQGEMAVTPLQLANAYATFANGGTVFEPRVADSVHEQGGAKVRDIPSRPVRKIDIPRAARDAILQGLVGAVGSPSGTAFPAFDGFPLSTFPVAGKTGTAQVGDKQDTSIFTAFAPVNEPRFLVTAVMEESGFGAESAAPVVRRILEGLAGRPPGPVTLNGNGAD